ncbi:NADPH-dependent FMN reductase [Pigmentiphaga soli]|uniref:NADPH-dependent FMN reductase n=1 Tax=Pigmentiphaga soli TaxID=1007095 RepID=A0ABP8HCX4_9BURK
MNAIKVGLIVGSLRKESINRRLAGAIVKMAPAQLQFEDIPIGDLPLYNQDLDTALPEPVQRFKQAVESAQALLFVTPEYNRSFPGVLKNALDWGSRPWGKSSWPNKPAGVIGASGSPVGTALAQEHLRLVLAALDVPTLAQPFVFVQHAEGLYDDSGAIANQVVRNFVQGFVDRYAAFVTRHVG